MNPMAQLLTSAVEQLPEHDPDRIWIEFSLQQNPAPAELLLLAMRTLAMRGALTGQLAIAGAPPAARGTDGSPAGDGLAYLGPLPGSDLPHPQTPPPGLVVTSHDPYRDDTRPETRRDAGWADAPTQTVLPDDTAMATAEQAPVLPAQPTSLDEPAMDEPAMDEPAFKLSTEAFPGPVQDGEFFQSADAAADDIAASQDPSPVAPAYAPLVDQVLTLDASGGWTPAHLAVLEVDGIDVSANVDLHPIPATPPMPTLA